VISAYKDTCIRQATSFTCRHCDNGSLILDTISHQWADSVIDGDTAYAYFWKMSGTPVNFVYFIKNIGLTMSCHEKKDDSQGFGKAIYLTRFNGVKNNLCRLLNDYHIDESYTYKKCTDRDVRPDVPTTW
jgi:hypothetical protein